MAFILVAEDSSDLREVYKQHLQNAGHRVITAANGFDALAAILQFTPDLILMDLIMPQMNGIQALNHLKLDPDFTTVRDIPVVLLTSHALPHEIHAGFQAGCIAYIIKPIDPREIIEELTLLLHSGEFSAPSYAP